MRRGAGHADGRRGGRVLRTGEGRQADCFDAALAPLLTARERLSCCRDHDKGCGGGAAAACAAKGLGCAAAWRAEQAALDLAEEVADARQAWVSLRLRLRGDSADVLARPKRQLALLRCTLLRGMPALRAAPEALVVTEVGVLAPGATLPPSALRAAWAVRGRRGGGARAAGGGDAAGVLRRRRGVAAAAAATARLTSRQRS